MKKTTEVGTKFGRLTVLKLGYPKWLMLCECGKEKLVYKYDILYGKTKSCGCLNRELATQRSTKHGLHTETKLYNIWNAMRARCNRKNSKQYADYGGRGIYICEEWNDFAKFHEWSHNNGYQEDLTLDRINNDGPYSPDNCRWVDMVVQSNNTRRNVRATIRGVTRTIAEHSRVYNINQSTLGYRYRQGWRDEELIKPVR
jgi:hypothetical protein